MASSTSRASRATRVPDAGAPVTGPTILVVDDSVVLRAVVTRTIEAHGRFTVTGAVADVPAALAFLAGNKVDCILLDIQMPGIDGLTALPDLLAAGGGAKVVVVSSSADDGGAVAVQALALGAADTLAKPASGGLGAAFAAQLIDKIARLHEPAAVVARPLLPAPRRRADAYDIVAIGASTGGMHALSQMLRTIPAAFDLPILITQHLPASFMPYFAAQIAVLARRSCDVAVDRLRIRPGRIVVAPGDAHIRCVSLGDGTAAVRLGHDPVASGCLPSVDPMFESLAQVYGARVLAIVLSGMGRDGAEGAARIHDAGGCIIVQDEASSVVWGMPGAVASAGLATAILSPEAIGRVVASRRRP